MILRGGFGKAAKMTSPDFYSNHLDSEEALVKLLCDRWGCEYLGTPYAPFEVPEEVKVKISQPACFKSFKFLLLVFDLNPNLSSHQKTSRLLSLLKKIIVKLDDSELQRYLFAATEPTYNY